MKDSQVNTVEDIVVNTTAKIVKKTTNARMGDFENLPDYQSVDTSELTENILSGGIKLLDKDLNLFIDDESVSNGVMIPPTYYEAGTFNQGEWQGYKRIIGILNSGNYQSGYSIFVFVSKDDNKYFIEDSSITTYNLSALNMQKVVVTDKFPTEHENVIILDEDFALFRKSMALRRIESSVTDDYDQYLSRYVLDDSFTLIQKLASTNSDLIFFANEVKTPLYYREILTDKIEEAEIRANYIQATTEVMVVDKTGLIYTYDLITTQTLNSYLKAKTQHESDELVYEQKKLEYDQKIKQEVSREELVYPDRPSYLSSPSIGIDGSDLETNKEIYKEYKASFPKACGVGLSTFVLKNVYENQLAHVSNEKNDGFWIFKDDNHPLLKLEFEIKISNSLDGDFLVYNESAKPSYEEYISKNPIILIKDYWDRFILLGEWDYNLPGGCGKPVIYLYPEKETEVSVSFLSSVNLISDIPDYHGAWNVLAHPDGSLKSLHSENCNDKDFYKFGSEYAKLACQNNSYPYLYWSGNIIGNEYPKIDKGWIVNRNNLENFLENKLTEINFNNKEKEDMLSYWLPKMLSHKTTYYKISFLQSQEMNELAPMLINPMPDKLFRIFLDWHPLEEKPYEYPEPQKLEKLQREGFTVVEWGGLIQ